MASGGSWRRLPSMGQLAAPDAPQLGLRLQGLGAGVSLVAHASLPSCFAVTNRSSVVRALPRLGQMAAVLAAGQWQGSPRKQAAVLVCPTWGVRDRMGPGLGPPRNRTECPQRTGLRADRMSGVARWVSLEQALCQAVVNRMSLAEWHVHLPGSACPATAYAMGFAVVGRLESHFANLFLLLWAVGPRSRE